MPVRGQTYYQESLSLPPSGFPALSEKVEAEVCIVGAGFTGLVAAYFLNKAGLDVIILEKDEIGAGASGRNGGQIIPGFEMGMLELVELFGPDKARILWTMSVEGIETLYEIAREADIACDIKSGVVVAAPREKHRKYLYAEFDLLQELCGYETCRYEGEDVEKIVGSKHYVAAIEDRFAGHFHPLKYVKGLADFLQKKGVRIYEKSAVLEYGEEQGVTVRTEQGRVQAKKLLLCGNAYLGRLNRTLRSHYLAMNSAIIVTAPLPKDLVRQVLPTDAACFEWRKMLHYFRLTADRRLLFGGADDFGRHGPMGIVREKTVCQLKGAMASLFHCLKDVEIEYGWTGRFAVASNFMPQIGRLSGAILYAHAYSGHGISGSHLCGKLLAEAVEGDLERFALLESCKGLPVFGNRWIDFAVAHAGGFWYRLTDD